MTGYQKLKTKYKLAYDMLWKMATAAPGDWMSFHGWAKETIDKLKEIDTNGEKK